MKTKTFLGLPVTESAGLYAIIRNYLSVILFTGIGYFLIAMLIGSINGDTWMYIQSVEKYYKEQFLFLIFAVLFSHLCRVLLNKFAGDKFFMIFKFDRFFYPLAFILTYLVINEIWGL